MKVRLPTMEALKNNPKIGYDDKFTNILYIEINKFAVSYMRKKSLGEIIDCKYEYSDRSILKSECSFFKPELLEEIIEE